MKILIDNGHGIDTPGKRSPDGSLHEYEYTRRLATAIVGRLPDAEIIVPELTDIPLKERVSRVNNICHRLSPHNVILISIHVNAAGMGDRWHTASGWSAFTALKPSESSCRLATIIQKRAIDAGLRGNRAIPHEGFWRQNLAICRDTLCPAILTENMFQDNRADIDFLLSESGFNTIVDLHVTAILQYLDTL